MVSTPRRISSLHAATPTNPAPPITSALVNVSGHEVDVQAVRLRQPAGQLAREHDRAVPATGAAEGDHDVHAALLLVQRQELDDDPLDVVKQPPRRRLIEHELRYRGVATREVAQLGDPVRVVEEARVDEQRGVRRRAVLVGEREAGHERSRAPAQVLRKLLPLPGLDAVVRALIRAAEVAVGVPVVDEDVLDPAPVGLTQQIGASVRQAEDGVGLAHAVELGDARVAGGLELGDGGFGALGARRADDHQGHRVSFRRAARRSGMPSFTISSTGASRIASTEPKCLRSTRLRAGPMPSTVSSGDVSALRERTLRWWVMANRCASSRTRWTRNIAGELRSRTIGSERPGAKISSRSLARANVGMSA